MGKAVKSFKLRSGVMPAVGLGCWKSPKNETREAVKVALQAGYRHIDTAFIYLNEKEVGEGIRDSGVPRKDIFVTTKIWNSYHQPAAVERGCDLSLERLGLDYVDLLLMHFPIAFQQVEGKNGTIVTMPMDEQKQVLTDQELSEDLVSTWRAMEQLVKKGKVRDIGICNFNKRRLAKLLQAAHIPPAVLQMELNLACDMPELTKYAIEEGIVVQAYSPFGSTGAPHRSNPLVQKLAQKYDCDPANILISWPLCRGLCVLPKSVTPSRIESNLRVIDLADSDIDALNKEASSGPIIRSVPKPYYGIDLYEGEHDRESQGRPSKL